MFIPLKREDRIVMGTHKGSSKRKGNKEELHCRNFMCGEFYDLCEINLLGQNTQVSKLIIWPVSENSLRRKLQFRNKIPSRVYCSLVASCAA